MTLKLQTELFALELLKGVEKSEAYKKAFRWEHLSSVAICERARRLAVQQRVQSYMQEQRLAIVTRAGITVEKVLQHWWAIHSADPNELSQLRRHCCRYCWGFNYGYQWVEAEFTDRLMDAVERGDPAPKKQGGFGYDKKLGPNSKCPRCYGEGVAETFLCDTRKLSAGARLLYRGVKQTKFGTEILMRDQDEALRNIAKFLGMLKDGNTVNVGVGVNTQQGAATFRAIIDADNPIEAGRAYAEFMSQEAAQ